MSREGMAFLGSIVVDRVIQVDSWPSAGKLGLIRGKEILGTGGSAWNYPVNIAAIDPSIPLEVCGVVGTDPLGDFAISHLKERSIKIDAIRRTGEASTSYSIVANSTASGLRTHLHDTGAGDFFDISDVESLQTEARFAHLGYLLLLKKLEAEDPEYGVKAARALDILRKKGCKTITDIVSLDGPLERFKNTITPCFEYLDYLIINEFEAGSLTGIDIRDEYEERIDRDALRGAAAKLLELGVGELVVIHFPEGALARTRAGDECSVGSFIVEPSKIRCVVGAGDAFASGVIYGLYKEHPLNHCLALGNANARWNIVGESCTDGVVALARLEETIANEPRRDSI